MGPTIGKFYRWPQVQSWGGQQCFLAKQNGCITCATLVKKENPDAPRVMLVGPSKWNIRRANEFRNQKEPIPVFIGEGTHRWHYKGRYICARAANPEEIKKYQSTVTRPLAMVLFLKPSKNQHNLTFRPDVDDEAISVREGDKRFVTHLQSERDHRIVKMKKDQVLREIGRLICEGCGFDFFESYRPFHGCAKRLNRLCECHHRIPISKLTGATETKLKDLAIMCSNCHRVIHLIDPMPSIEKFRKILKGTKPKK